jgi:hypothetical protein
MVIRINDGVARFGLPGLVLGALLAWASVGRGPAAAAQSDGGGPSPPKSAGARPSEPSRVQGARALAGGESNGTLALITSSAAGPVQWLYLIDTKDRSFALYRIDPMNSKGIVKLEASRQYKWDLKLEHYNNQAPEPDAIKATVETLTRSAQTQ